MGLDITDIEHPEFIHTMLISGLQLLPHLGDMRHGEPLAGSRRTIITYMIIHTIAALVEIFLSIRKSAHMTEIVIAKHHDDIIGHLESLVIIIEYLTVECPDLWGLGGWFPGNISYDFRCSEMICSISRKLASLLPASVIGRSSSPLIPMVTSLS